VGDKIALRDQEMNLIATITINSIWVPDKSLEAEKVFGSPDDKCHPAIAYLFDRAGSHYVGGEIQGFQLPVHYDFTDLRRTERAHSHARTFGRRRRSPTARCCLLPAAARFSSSPSVSATTARSIQGAFVPANCRLPNSQPDAPLAPRAHHVGCARCQGSPNSTQTTATAISSH